MKINWITFAANSVYLLFVIFMVYLLATLTGKDPDDLVGWFALGMAASHSMGNIFK
jgi:hypothetical protein